MSSEHDDLQPAAGVLLVAAANLLDPNFSRTVILLCEHQPEGTFGLVLNRKLPIRLRDVVSEDLGWDANLYRGGPVQENSLHYIHARADLNIDSQEVCPGIYWGGDFERLSQLLKYGEADVDDFRFFVGYSGWGEGQLDGEIDQDSWYLRKARPDLVFDKDATNLWRRTLASMGNDFRLLANFPDDPRMN